MRPTTCQPKLSNHLACLRGCGLVQRQREGRRVRYELASFPLAHALNDLVTGAVVAIVGTGLMFLAQLGMGDQWRIGVDPSERTDLVTTGVFGVVRNPIFSALAVAAAGLAVLVPNPISAAGVVMLIVAIEIQVRSVEEPHLRKVHGDSYAAYEARVGRLVPWIGRR